uniref:CHK domain-containing protein n=1 Tax=Rhabditophanes sp. KR3021 TaxID=114890 RepID=A0AC35UB85_9BILA
MSAVLFHEKYISSDSFTYGWVYDQLSEKDLAFKTFINDNTIVDASSFDISAGKGCFSEVFKITFATKEGPKYNTILKVPGSSIFEKAVNSSNNVDDSGNIFKNSAEMESGIVELHNREVDFYTKFSIEGIPIPEVFNATYWKPNIKQKGCLLMRDLDIDSKGVDLSQSLSASQSLQIAECIAKLQAYSILNKEYVDSLNYKLPFRYVDFGPMVNCRLPAFINKFKDQLGEDALNVLKDGVDPKFEHFIDTKLCSFFNVPNVLSHSDCWTNNIAWLSDKYGNATSELKCIMDWQVLFSSNPANDLARFMILSLDGDIRRKYSNAINQHYYKTLTNELAAKNVAVPFTYENYEKVYSYNYIRQSVQLILMVSVFITHTNFDKDEENIRRAFSDKLILRTKHALEDARVYMEQISGEWKE